MYIMIGLMVLLVGFGVRAWMCADEDTFVGWVAVTVLVLIFMGTFIGVSRFIGRQEIIQFQAFKESLEGYENPEILENLPIGVLTGSDRLSILETVVRRNTWLRRAQHWNQTQWSICIQNEVDNMEPLTFRLPE